ncbi:hypothetical protein [Sphingomonas sp. PAMC 26617]|uniref:hypothetical protein n=1 Tax=Sphingomonas sp. PAMC 26617 TaxID=1112216 RepID=UPI0002FD914F|nr:hypothetical protein [Sphingomonas sp. PAMC 26617]
MRGKATPLLEGISDGSVSRHGLGYIERFAADVLILCPDREPPDALEQPDKKDQMRYSPIVAFYYLDYTHHFDHQR